MFNSKSYGTQTKKKKYKNVKDHKTAISCLRKKVAYSKFTSKPVLDLDQFQQLPRAICDADGIPENGQKPSLLQFLRKCILIHLSYMYLQGYPIQLPTS
jgi:hypothetical protein